MQTKSKKVNQPLENKSKKQIMNSYTKNPFLIESFNPFDLLKNKTNKERNQWEENLLEPIKVRKVSQPNL